QLADLRLKARLLPYFTHHRLCRGLPNIGPPTWERPQAIRLLAHEQDVVSGEDGAAHVYLGCRIPLFSLEKIADQRRVHLRIGSQDLCRHTAHLLVAFTVKEVRAKHQAILRDGLETPGPRYPACFHMPLPLARITDLDEWLALFQAGSGF